MLRRFGEQRAISVEPVGAAVEREPRLELERALHVGAAHVRRIADDDVEPLRAGSASNQCDSTKRTSSASRALRSRARRRAPRCSRRCAVTCASGRACLTASAMAPLPVPTSSTAGRGERRASRERALDEQLGLRPRNQHLAATRAAATKRTRARRRGTRAARRPRAARRAARRSAARPRARGALRKREERAARRAGRDTRAAPRHRAAATRCAARERASRGRQRSSVRSHARACGVVGRLGASHHVSSRGPAPRAGRPGTRSRAARSRRRDRR